MKIVQAGEDGDWCLELFSCQIKSGKSPDALDRQIPAQTHPRFCVSHGSSYLFYDLEIGTKPLGYQIKGKICSYVGAWPEDLDKLINCTEHIQLSAIWGCLVKLEESPAVAPPMPSSPKKFVWTLSKKGLEHASN